jgi:PAS domain S-box-containing protein
MPDERRLSDLEAETKIPVVLVDQRGIITRINLEFEKLFGWSSREAVGSPLTIIIPETMREAHLKGFSRLLATGEPRLLSQPVRLPAITKSGREFMAEHFIVGEKRAGEWAFGATIREMMPRIDVV